MRKLADKLEEFRNDCEAAARRLYEENGRIVRQETELRQLASSAARLSYELRAFARTYERGED